MLFLQMILDEESIELVCQLVPVGVEPVVQLLSVFDNDLVLDPVAASCVDPDGIDRKSVV